MRALFAAAALQTARAGYGPSHAQLAHDASSGESAPVAPAVLRDGQVGEEHRDGQHAGVQVMEQLRDLLEHALAHLPPWPRPQQQAASVQADRLGRAGRAQQRRQWQHTQTTSAETIRPFSMWP